MKVFSCLKAVFISFCQVRKPLHLTIVSAGIVVTAIAAPSREMKPIVGTARGSTLKKKVMPHQPATSTKAKVVKKTAKPKKMATSKPSSVDFQRVRRLEAQILQVRADRQRWEEYKKGLLSEFTSHQSAFAAALPAPEESQAGSPLLLALFSQSMDDFVHSRVMMNYLTAYRVQKNQAYVNLVHNIQQADYALQNYAKLEQHLIQQWQAEKTKANPPVLAHNKQ